MTLVIIPSRMGSTRLPGKPLLKIGDTYLIERCVQQARKAGFDPIVACDSEEIAGSITCGYVISSKYGLEEKDCHSGTDRVAHAAETIDPEGKHEFVINYQGDMPFLDPEDLKKFVWATERSGWGITTAWSPYKYVEMDGYLYKRAVVKSHIGLYGFERETLRTFASLPQSEAEISEQLEQLRAPERFKWQYVELPSMPIEINTQADLDRARSCLM